MEKNKIKSEGLLEDKDSVNELMDEIINLKFRLKRKDNELHAVKLGNQNLLRKLNHNLKNPIGIIFSYAEIMLEDIEDCPPEATKKYLEIIKKSTGFLVQLLNSIASYSSLQSPEMVFCYKKLNYIDLLDRIIDRFRPESIKNRIGIKRNYSSNEVEMSIDADRISKALYNIIDNAFRYSSPKSTITIHVTEKPHTVETVITDEGIGILEEDLPKVFHEFYVVNTYSEDTKKCIGLGLTTANRIVQRHQGKIELKSAIGSGTSVKITLPKKLMLN